MVLAGMVARAILLILPVILRTIFGKRFFYALHPDSINNLILAELELQENLENPLYDFTSIIVKIPLPQFLMILKVLVKKEN